MLPTNKEPLPRFGMASALADIATRIVAQSLSFCRAMADELKTEVSHVEQASFIVSTVVVAVALTFAPVVAQEMRDSGGDTRTTTSVADDREDLSIRLSYSGLLGLVGLVGLMRKPNQVDHDRADDRRTGRRTFDRSKCLRDSNGHSSP